MSEYINKALLIQLLEKYKVDEGVFTIINSMPVKEIGRYIELETAKEICCEVCDKNYFDCGNTKCKYLKELESTAKE